MPRGPRFIFENAFYHVFNRGVNKQAIFLSPTDYEFFLDRLKKLQKKYDHCLYALCLMPNHFHLSIRTKNSPISKIMASLTTSYSMYFNRTHSHFGPVFQNRFKSILIENDNYFLTLSRYIYLNPVKDGLSSDPAEYPYSSFKEAIGLSPLSFLDPDIIRLVGETARSREQYKKFVYEGIKEDSSDIDRLFKTEEAMLGSNLFASRSRGKYLRRMRRKTFNS